MAQQADMLMVMRAKDELTKPLARAQEQLGKTAKAGKDLNGQLRLMRGGVGQIGHQIQDMAVQAQMGTSAFVILGQQGSQVASLLGPKGAMFGAVLAIGAAIAGPLYKSLTESTDLLEELETEAKKATTSLYELSGAQRAIAETVLLERRTKVLDAQRIAEERLAEATERKTTKAVVRLRGQVNQNAQAFEQATIDVDRYEKQVGLANAELERIDDALSGVDPQLQKTNKSLQHQVDTYGMNNLAAAAYKAQLDGVIDSEEALNLALLSELETLDFVEKARKDAAKAEAKAAKDLKSSLAIEEKKDVAAGKAFTSMVEGMFGPEERIQVEMEKRLGIVDEALARGQINLITAENMRTVIEQEASKKRIKNAEDEEKLKNDQRKKAIAGVGDQLMALDASNKKVFMMQKAYKIVQATMDARTAFSNALAAPFPPPIPQMLAGAALAMGMANVATIKSQSFEGGGFTGFGARAGGLDGKGGRMAMVHPNESIIDHTKGGASGITVINNVDARGSGADVDQKIKSAMAQTSQQTIMTIQDLMRRRRFA